MYVSVFGNCDAGRVRALTADELTLDKSDTYAACGECHGTVLARRAGADDDDVVVGHVAPIRFSCPCADAARRRRAPQRVIEREVGIEPPSKLGVKLLCTVDIGDQDHNHLKFQIHVVLRRAATRVAAYCRDAHSASLGVRETHARAWTTPSRP